MGNLTHLSESKLEELRSDVRRNLNRYLESGFADLVLDPGWSIDLREQIDLAGLEELDGSDNRAETDLKNTIVVERVLGSMSPALANEERVWVRLSHVEAFRYCRDRWLQGITKEEEQLSAIATHFFAKGQTGVRDDHALSRLWWNAYIVKRCYPMNFVKGLELLLVRADVRSNLVERIWLTGRRQLGAGVFRRMEQDPRVLRSERSFREFMKALNFLGGGIVFEAMTDAQVDVFLTRCVEHAEQKLEAV